MVIFNFQDNRRLDDLDGNYLKVDVVVGWDHLVKEGGGGRKKANQAWGKAWDYFVESSKSLGIPKGPFHYSSRWLFSYMLNDTGTAPSPPSATRFPYYHPGLIIRSHPLFQLTHSSCFLRFKFTLPLTLSSFHFTLHLATSFSSGPLLKHSHCLSSRALLCHHMNEKRNDGYTSTLQIP